jgi:hypothetical protein
MPVFTVPSGLTDQQRQYLTNATSSALPNTAVRRDADGGAEFANIYTKDEVDALTQDAGPHTHVLADISDAGTMAAASAADYLTATQVNTALATKAAAVHTHAVSDVTSLQTALDGKAASTHTHAVSDVTGLQSALNGKAATAHTHTISDTSGLQTALDGKAAASHVHAVADVTGLQAALDAKAAVAHTHSISDTTGLQTALDAKAAASHTHTLSQISDAGTMAAQAATNYYTKGEVNGIVADVEGGGGGPHTHVLADITDAGTMAAQNAADYFTAAETTAQIGLSTELLVGATTFNAHVADTGNPHAVTAAQVGAYTTTQVDTALLTKANATTVNTHLSNTSNPHSTTAAQVGAYTTAEVDTALATKAASTHTHAIADTTGLQTALDGKAAASHTHTIANVTGLQTALDGKAASAHSHTLSQISDAGTMAGQNTADYYTATETDAQIGLRTELLASNASVDAHVGDLANPHATTAAQVGAYTTAQVDTALATKSNTGHTHSISDVTSLSTNLLTKTDKTIPAVTGNFAALNGSGNITDSGVQSSSFAAASHTHTIANVTSLQTALDGKAATSHTHAIADTTGLQTALDGKAAATHTHAAADITSGTIATARLGSGTASSTTVLKGNQTWAALTATDVGAAATSHTHTLSQITDAGTMAVQAATNYYTKTEVDSAVSSSGGGLTKPNTRRWSSGITAGFSPSFVENLGWTIFSEAGTKSAIEESSSLPAYIQTTTTTTTNNLAGFLTYPLAFRNKNSLMQVRARLPNAADRTSARTTIGYTDDATLAVPVDSPTTGNHAWFRFSSSASDTTWKAVTNGGGTSTVTDTGISGDTAFHKFEIAMSASNVVFKIDGVTVATHTTNLPTSTTALRHHAAITTLTTAAKNLQVSYFYNEID